MTPSRIEQIVEGLDKILSNPALIHYQGENAVLKSYFRASLLQVAEEAEAKGRNEAVDYVIGMSGSKVGQEEFHAGANRGYRTRDVTIYEVKDWLLDEARKPLSSNE